jgi:hypothetical protein
MIKELPAAVHDVLRNDDALRLEHFHQTCSDELTP